MHPMDRLAWMIGAGVITLAALALAVIGCMIGWAALRATCALAGQLWRHHVTLGRTRAEWQATPGEAWCSEFWRAVR